MAADCLYNADMGIEIEAKFRIGDMETMRRKLLAAGACPMGTVLEDNTYFDTPDARLRQSDCGLRIRTVKPTDGGAGRSVLTYKGPRRAGELKIRAEEETAIDSPAAARAILAGLGYQPTASFQKRRESFCLGAARIELDELPALGFFLEIEAGDEKTVQSARKILGLTGEPTITKTYIEMVAEHLAARTASGASAHEKLNF